MSAILSKHTGLRPLAMGDLQTLMEIERRAYPYPWTIGIFRDCLRVGYCCWCYERAGCIDGYGVMSVAVGEAHILNLTVRPEAQRQGIGARLMQHFMPLARRHNAKALLFPLYAMVQEGSDAGLRQRLLPGLQSALRLLP